MNLCLEYLALGEDSLQKECRAEGGGRMELVVSGLNSSEQVRRLPAEMDLISLTERDGYLYLIALSRVPPRCENYTLQRKRKINSINNINNLSQHVCALLV